MMMNNKPARAAAAQLDSANEQPTPQAGLNEHSNTKPHQHN